jgi:hypothetical protein
MALALQTCAHHPGRVGFALCMSCRRVVCQECATTWDGVNHCRPCLLQKRAAVERRTPWAAWLWWAGGAALLFAASGYAMAWAGALFARALS